MQTRIPLHQLAAQVGEERPARQPDGSYLLAAEPVTGTLILSAEGVRLAAGVDYQLVGASIYPTSAWAEDALVVAAYLTVAAPYLRLSSTAPAALGPVALAGVAGEAARSDHCHPLPAPEEIGAVSWRPPLTGDDVGAALSALLGEAALLSGAGSPGAGVAGEEGDYYLDSATGLLWLRAAGTWAASAYLQDLVATEPSPAALGAATPGTSDYPSRADHVHPLPTAEEVGAAAAGHTHPAPDLTALLGSTAGAALAASGAAGAAATAARSDHAHPLPTAAQVGAAAASHAHAAGDLAALLGSSAGTALSASGAAGAAATAARSDHAHPLPTAAQVGAAAASHTHSPLQVGLSSGVWTGEVLASSGGSVSGAAGARLSTSGSCVVAGVVTMSASGAGVVSATLRAPVAGTVGNVFGSVSCAWGGGGYLSSAGVDRYTVSGYATAAGTIQLHFSGLLSLI